MGDRGAFSIYFESDTKPEAAWIKLGELYNGEAKRQRELRKIVVFISSHIGLSAPDIEAHLTENEILDYYLAILENEGKEVLPKETRLKDEGFTKEDLEKAQQILNGLMG